MFLKFNNIKYLSYEYTVYMNYYTNKKKSEKENIEIKRIINIGVS